MRIITQQRHVIVPFSDGRRHSYSGYARMGTCQTAARQGKLQGVNRDHFHSKFLLFIDRLSHQYWFWRGFMASLVTPDHHFAQDASTTWHSCSYFHPYTDSHSLVPRAHYLWFKLPHLHVLWPGARLRNKVQPTTVMKLLWDFAYVPKGSYRWELHRLFWLYMQWAFNHSAA